MGKTNTKMTGAKKAITKEPSLISENTMIRHSQAIKHNEILYKKYLMRLRTLLRIIVDIDKKHIAYKKSGVSKEKFLRFP